jgi:leader peptidase (prepilin peptidase) / N-methyltransferase
MIIVMLVVLGVCLGSFVNAWVFRLHRQLDLEDQIEQRQTGKSKKNQTLAIEKLRAKQRQLSVAHGRSICMHCKHPLSAKDLVPIVSYLSLRGKCRYCGKKIDDTPLAELLVPTLFVLSYVAWPVGLQGLEAVRFGLWLVCVVAFVALTVYDLRWYMLPDRITKPLIAVAALFFALGFFRAAQVSEAASALADLLVAALFLPGLFAVLYYKSDGRWIGGGDVKLAIVLALLLPSAFAAPIVLFVASSVGLLAVLPRLVTGRAGWTTRIPFGPFLIVGAIVAVLFTMRLENLILGDL